MPNYGVFIALAFVVVMGVVLAIVILANERRRNKNVNFDADSAEWLLKEWGKKYAPKMFIQQSMGNAVLRSIPEKGIYHFDVVIQHMGDPKNDADNAPMQNAIVGTVIVKIRNHEISTYEFPCDCINNKIGITQMLSLGKDLAIKQAWEIEKFITD